MPNESDQFSWFNDGLKKLVVAAVVGLVGVGAAKLRIIPANLKDITDPQNWPLWAVIVLLFVAYQFGWPPLWRAFLRCRVPSAKPGKISVLLARLNEDKGDRLRETVREAIVGQLGDAVEVIPWPEFLQVGEGRYADASTKAQSKAQNWLKAKSCDLLVWGRVKGDKTIALRFTPCEGSHLELRSYGLSADTLDLPVEFISDLAAAVSARIVAEAARAIHMRGHYLVPLMRASAERFGPIIKKLNPNFDADTRASLLHSYALVRDAIGDQTGSNGDLLQAITTYQATLREWTRERVPLKWAMTQNNLGTALGRLGERDSGTARLEEAVAAFREASREWTRERVPLDWAITQTNLGTALVRLGERESGTARLKEGVAAYREALREWTREREPLNWAGIRTISAPRLRASASARAVRRGWRKRLSPFAKRCGNGRANAYRSIGP